jgi:hypothetical protein
MPLRPFTDDDARELPPGFLLVLSARSGAGKSTIVQHILSLPSMRGRFASAVVVSPTSMLAGKTPTQFACVPAGLHYKGNQLTEVIDKVIAAQKKAREAGRMGEVLLVCDDVFGSTRGQGQNNTRFLEFISTRRHWGGGVAVICIQQHLRCLAPSVRAQVSAFMASRPHHRRKQEEDDGGGFAYSRSGLQRLTLRFLVCKCSLQGARGAGHRARGAGSKRR